MFTLSIAECASGKVGCASAWSRAIILSNSSSLVLEPAIPPASDKQALEGWLPEVPYIHLAEQGRLREKMGSGWWFGLSPQCEEKSHLCCQPIVVE
ncbi:unnamed protein product, partial [Staurois parvus]